MKTQSDKAFSAAEKLYKLQSAGRAERNRANLFYEWEAADSQVSWLVMLNSPSNLTLIYGAASERH